MWPFSHERAHLYYGKTLGHRHSFHGESLTWSVVLAQQYGSDGFCSALPVEFGIAHHAMSLRMYMFRANLFFHFLEVIILSCMQSENLRSLQTAWG